MDDALPASDTRDDFRDVAEAPDVDPERRTRVREVLQRLQHNADVFSRNVASATVNWTQHITDDAMLETMPARAKARGTALAAAEQRRGFLFTLDRQSYEAAIHHVEDRRLRHDLYEAYVTRASDHGPRAGHFDNTAVIQDTLALRHELALLGGYENYAALALRHGVLQTPEAVERYLLRGGAEVRARAQSELTAIWAFAKSLGAPKSFSTWDLEYYAHRWCREQLDFAEEDLCPYLPLRGVLAGAATLIERIFGVRCVATSASLSAHAPTIYRLTCDDADELGLLEIELCDAKSPTEAAPAEPVPGDKTLPTLRLKLDLAHSVADEPALLAHTEVAALFRQLGSGIFRMRTEKTGSRSATQRQADETMSQIAGSYFELACWRFDTLNTFARHWGNGTSMPPELFDKLLRSRERLAGLAASLRLELALFDLRVHRDYVPVGRATQLRAHVFDTLAQVRREVCVLRPPFWEHMPNTCTAMFAEDCAGRLWERSWAQQLAHELFAQFEASGYADDVARRTRDTLWAPSKRGLLDRLTLALGRAPDLRV